MRAYMKKITFGAVLAMALNLIVLVPATLAITVNMTASPTTVTMPDGVDVTMWGYSIPADPDYATPFGPNGPPVIRAIAGVDNLVINLTNNLGISNPALRSETSVVIPGQDDTTMTPQFFTDDELRQRAYSFTAVTTNGATGTYTWDSLEAGTYLIQSGTHSGIQVPMGLYAVLIVDEGAAGNAYTGITYTTDIPLLFSEVDSGQHLAVSNGTYGTAAYPTTMAAGYDHDYFMINGMPFTPGQSPISAGAIGETVLLRFLNAGIRPRQPIIQGARLTVVAEDGNAFTDIGVNAQEYDQYTIDLVAGKTMDALLTSVDVPPVAVAEGYYPIYDRRLGLTNGMESNGGMMTSLAVGPQTSILTVATAGNGTGRVQSASLPGGIDSAATTPDLTEAYLPGTEVTLKATGDPGSLLTGWMVTDGGGVNTGECQAPLADPYGDCVVTMDSNKTVTATFTSYSVVTIVTPNGGETLLGGSGYTVRWGAPANAVTYSLAYSFGASSPWKVIAKGVTGNQYVFVVPETVPNHGDLYVAVVGYDSTGAVVGMDVSDQPAQRNGVALLTPSASGIVLTGGATYDITWASYRVPGTVASIGIWYQTAPATPWKMITVLDTDAGSYTWTVPSVVTTEALVGVIFYDSMGGPLYLDASDNLFEIQ